MFVAGIDYSITSPAICVHRGDEWSFTNCRFFFLTEMKKKEGTYAAGKIIGSYKGDYSCNEDRFQRSSDWARKIFSDLDTEPQFIALEDYAMGAKGRVFHIGENTGILKNMLWKQRHPFVSYAPTLVKKFATGKGNADKAKMQEAFLAETGFDVKAALGLKETDWNPSSDVIDAYWLAKLAFQENLK